MDKQMIKEMAKDVKAIRESYFGQSDYLFAKQLFERGYRKTPGNAVVFIPTEEKYAILSQKEYQRCERIEKIIKLAKQIADKNKGVGV